MPSFIVPSSTPRQESSGSSYNHDVAWRYYLRNMETASRLWSSGYSFIILGKDIHHISDLECGEPVALMLIVTSDGIPVDPLKVGILHDIIAGIDEYESESPSMFVRPASWVRGRIHGPIELYIHCPQDTSGIVPIDIHEVVESLVCVGTNESAPIMEFDPRYPLDTSVGVIQRTCGYVGDRACVKVRNDLYSIR